MQTQQTIQHHQIIFDKQEQHPYYYEVYHMIR